MRAHGLRGGGQGLDRVHHGLGGHHRSSSLRQGDWEWHLHEAMRDGDDGGWIHDGRHGSRVGNMHVHSIL